MPGCRWKSNPKRPPSKEFPRWQNYLRRKCLCPAVRPFLTRAGLTPSLNLHRAAFATRPSKKPWNFCTCPIPTNGIRRQKTGTCPKTGNRFCVTPLKSALKSTARSSCSWTSACVAAPAPTSATSSLAPTTPRTCPCCAPSFCARCTAATTPCLARFLARKWAPVAGTRK